MKSGILSSSLLLLISFASARGLTADVRGANDVDGLMDLAVLSASPRAGGGSDTGPTYHSGTISMDETWYPSGNPHIIIGDVGVQDAANSPILTIMPGCIVEFQGDYELYTGYTEAGAIVANGKPDADSGIVFTTTASPKTPGSWDAVCIYYRATAATSFDYCTFEYGGSNSSRGAFCVDRATPKFQHSTVMQSASSGVVLTNDASFASFTGNTVSNCGGHAVEMYPEHVKTLGSGNTYSGNTKNDILVRSGTVLTTATWLNQGVPYTLAGDVRVEDASNTPVLTIAPGTAVKMQADVELYCGYSQPGGIIADGTAGQITFTSSSPLPSPGDWVAISFYYRAIDSQCRLRNCRIEYGGSYGGNIHLGDAKPMITGCDIGYSSDYGIYLNGTEYPDPSQLRADNTFHDNPSGDIRVPGVGIEEESPARSRGPDDETKPATIVRGVLFLGDCPRTMAVPRTALLDISGRRMIELQRGANDVRALTPGVYFLREAQVKAQAVRKVIVTR